MSEILAQQTRIAAMLPFYERFIARFPTVRDLADAEADEVLALWAGMGYYARARNLHAAAQIVRDKYGGALPALAEELRALPGVGAYTAGAIASIAFGLSEPAVDGNVRRVYSRLLAIGDVSGAEDWVRASMREAQKAGHTPGEVTEALMELGALVCLPKTPRCGGCPWEADCKAKQNGEIGQYPIRPVKKEKPVENKVIIVATDEMARFLMRKRTESILHKMLEFPDESTLVRDGFTVTKTGHLTDAEHIFTHRVWRMSAYFADVAPPAIGLPEGYSWVSRAEMDSLAIPGAMRPFVNALDRADGHAERARRWRLMLGPGAGPDAGPMDAAMSAVYGDAFHYDPDGNGKNTRDAARWMRDIRACFSEEAVDVMVSDAIGKHEIESLLLQPEALRNLPRDTHTAALVLRHKQKIPAASAALARQLVGAVADEIQCKLELPLHNAVSGAANRRVRSRQPSKALDWHGTIKKNLGRYDAGKRVITPERFLFFQQGARRADMMIALDQSASMAHTSILAVAAAAALAMIPALRVRLFAFDTAVTELTEKVTDPAEILFRLRLSGGTDIANAVSHCQGRITQPKRTALILITDLQESPDGAARLTKELEAVTRSGVPVAILLPNAHNRQLAQELTAKGALCAVMTPDTWPDMVEKLL